MPYLCNDCGNKSSRQFPGGRCPACDSFNIRNTTPSTRQAIREKEPKTLLEIVLLCLLWGALAYGAWDRYLRKEEPAKPAAPAAMPKLLQDKIKTAPAEDF
ncbi:hypothetical protein EV700_0951 [Fluviicoccus keumensis]|uniref:Uncharacterized protein n=1 Tax=Fluviicoccus keumensis TaxID=1435465 RepID=A0A4Q7ZBI4_9GAMM|nr:hypothetical protein [Fluviicoccus keumensis]RZU47982.1 hypothetical protein EV700_0951 [Fluviicoccus keumensis]